jgi:hypothetical protein
MENERVENVELDFGGLGNVFPGKVRGRELGPPMRISGGRHDLRLHILKTTTKTFKTKLFRLTMASGYGLHGGMYSIGPLNPYPQSQLCPSPTLQPQYQQYTPANSTLTGPSRCFPFWQELLACYVVNSDSEDTSGKQKCVPVLEDYYECLHHKKEVCLSPLERACHT